MRQPKQKYWIEIRRGPLQGSAMRDRPFTVALCSYPRGAGEPIDPTNLNRGARGMAGAATFEEACLVAATYALPEDPAWRRAKARFDSVESLRRGALYEQFLAKGEPE